jgi:WD40 repeat protein
MRILRIPRGNFNAVAYSADGEHLLAVHSGWRLRVWATADLSERYAAQLPGLGYAHSSIEILGDLAVLTSGIYSLAPLWASLRQVGGTRRERDLIREVPLEGRGRFSQVRLTVWKDSIINMEPDYRQQLTWLHVHDQEGRRQRSIAAPVALHWINTLAITPGRSSAALGSWREVILFDLDKEEEGVRLEHTDVIQRAVFSPDGRWLATAAGRSVWLWDVASRTGERFPAFQKHAEGLAFHPEGKLLAAGDRDGEIRLWEPASRRQQASLNFGVGAVHGLAFSPDGMTVAAAGHDNAVAVWDLE